MEQGSTPKGIEAQLAAQNVLLGELRGDIARLERRLDEGSQRFAKNSEAISALQSENSRLAAKFGTLEKLFYGAVATGLGGLIMATIQMLSSRA